jgi:hypothetical protein
MGVFFSGRNREFEAENLGDAKEDRAIFWEEKMILYETHKIHVSRREGKSASGLASILRKRFQ